MGATRSTQPFPTQPGVGREGGGDGVYRGRTNPPAGGRRTTLWRGRYTPDVAVTTAQVRQHRCPRCLAKSGDPCRNQVGAAVSAGHADRRKLAQQAEYRRLRGGTRVSGSGRGESSPLARSDTDTAGIGLGVTPRQPVPERVGSGQRQAAGLRVRGCEPRVWRPTRVAGGQRRRSSARSPDGGAADEARREGGRAAGPSGS